MDRLYASGTTAAATGTRTCAGATIGLGMHTGYVIAQRRRNACEVVKLDTVPILFTLAVWGFVEGVAVHVWGKHKTLFERSHELVSRIPMPSYVNATLVHGADMVISLILLTVAIFKRRRRDEARAQDRGESHVWAPPRAGHLRDFSRQLQS